MTKDIDALHSVLLSITVVSEKLRTARQNLQVRESGEGVPARLLSELESDLCIAKATLGGELGFDLCPRCWPPELVAADSDGHVHCPACGQISFEKAA